MDEAERPRGEEAHQRHPSAPSDLQRRELLWGKCTEMFHNTHFNLLYMPLLRRTDLLHSCTGRAGVEDVVN